MSRARVLIAAAFLLAAGAWLAAAQSNDASSMSGQAPSLIAQAGVQRVDVKASRYQFTPNIIRLKAGVPVELHLMSTDVVHGFDVPALKINRRLVPGKEVVVDFTAKAGTYPFHCSVYCGPGHREMKGELIVE
jgi:cytochrome c oxidase subunit 2